MEKILVCALTHSALHINQVQNNKDKTKINLKYKEEKNLTMIEMKSNEN